MNRKNDNWAFQPDIASDAVSPGITRKVLTYCDEAMCVENHFETGAVGPLHHHPHTQITYVAEGAFTFTIGDVTHTVRKGDALLKQHGIVHGCTCIEQGVLVDFFTPMRKEFVGEE